MDFRDALLLVNANLPYDHNLSMNNLIVLADAVSLESTPKTLAQQAKASQVIVDFVATNQRIKAIKELRQVAQCGLKEAKDAVDEAFPPPPVSAPATWQPSNPWDDEGQADSAF